MPSSEPKTCPACGGPLALLGSLGSREWLRCLDCGLESSHASGTKLRKRKRNVQRKFGGRHA